MRARPRAQLSGAPLRLLDLARAAFALLVLAAIGYQAGSLAERDAFVPENFFSFFTIQSNLLAAAVLVVAALWGAGDRTLWLEALRGAATLYMAITGVVFALLLSGLQEELQTTIPWVDFVLHKLFPIVVVADWLLDPPRRRLSLRLAGLYLLYPVAYFVYSVVRGALVDWYPYPFLDAGRIGYDGVAWRAVVLLAGMIVAALAVVWVGNRLGGLRGRPVGPLEPAAR